MNQSTRCRAALLSLGLVTLSAQAGPPLTIEDPEILDPGQWEIIVASTLEKRESGKTYELPLLDVSYGVSENIQVAFVAPRIVSDPKGESKRSDFGISEIGIKWRFYNENNLQIAFAPLYEFNLRDGAVDRGIVDDANAWTVPLTFQYDWNDWTFLADVGYTIARGDEDGLAYGFAVSRPVSERTALMASIYGEPDTSFDDHGLAIRLGLDHQISDDFHLLVGVGTGLQNEEDDLDVDVYIGLQWFR